MTPCCGEERSSPANLIYHLGTLGFWSGFGYRTLQRYCQGFSDPLIITPATLQCGHQDTARGDLECIKLGFLFSTASEGEGLEEEWIDVSISAYAANVNSRD